MNIIDSMLILGSQDQSATNSSTVYTLTAGTTVMVTNEGPTNLVRVAFGGGSSPNSAPAATANSTPILPSQCRQFSVRDGSTLIAIKTDAATTPVNITTGEGVSSS